MIFHITSENIDTNSYIIEEGGYGIIVDPAMTLEIDRVLRDEGIKAEYIFLTHEHFDHIVCLEEVRNKYGIPVIANEKCSERIQKVSTNLSNIADMLKYFKTGQVPEEKSDSFVCRQADMEYGDEHTMKWRGHEFRFRRAPGHSPGSVLIYMDGDILFTGDYMIYGEEELTRLRGGSQEDFEKYTQPLLDQVEEGTLIYPGHGISYRKESSEDGSR